MYKLSTWDILGWFFGTGTLFAFGGALVWELIRDRTGWRQP